MLDEHNEGNPLVSSQPQSETCTPAIRPDAEERLREAFDLIWGYHQDSVGDTTPSQAFDSRAHAWIRQMAVQAEVSQ